jgi:hypothetical protein
MWHLKEEMSGKTDSTDENERIGRRGDAFA